MRSRHWSGQKINDYKAHFWSNVDIRPDPEACWEWKLSRNIRRGGYGTFYVSCKPMRAHRAAYQFTFGEIPSGLVVLHKCDNPPCCNPNHLSLGTLKDNSLDCIAKGRHKTLPGSRNHQARFTEADVIEMRRLFSNGISMAQIARQFDTNASRLHQIVYRKEWKHV